MTLRGFVWREAFPGPPNYESLKTDQKEVYWMLVLRRAVTLIAISPEDEGAYRVENITRLQLMLNQEQYADKRHLVLRDAEVIGRMWPSHTGHHHGDALIEVSEIQALSLEPLDLG